MEKMKVFKKIGIISLIIAIIVALGLLSKSKVSYAADNAVLNITMNVSDERFDILDATECNIFVYINDANNEPIEGNFSYSGDESGTVTFTEGKGELILHGASSSVKFENLPEGAKYKVELRKYGCWYNEKTSSGKEGTLGADEKTALITCTVNTMDQKVIAVIDMVDKIPGIFDNNFEYYLGDETVVPQPKDGVLYYTGTDEVKLFEVTRSSGGGLRVSSKVVLEDNGVAVLHNVPYNRNPQTFHRRNSDVYIEEYGIYGTEGFIVYGENEFEENDSRKLMWAGTSGISGEYVVMRAAEEVGYVSNLIKLYARQDENGEIVTVEPDFVGGEEEKEHTFRIRMYYHSALGEDHNFYVKNYVLPISIVTVGSGEDPVEDTIKLDENGEAYIKLKANQACKIGIEGQSLSTIPYDYSLLTDVEFDEDGNLIIDERFHSVSDKMLSVPHSGYEYYGEIEIDEIQEEGEEAYTVHKYVGEDIYSLVATDNNYISDYILNHSEDYQSYLWWLPFSTAIINTRNFTGELDVKKEFEGECDPNREFTFRIKFEDDASDLKDFYMNNIYLDYGDRKVHLELDENYEGTFKLKAGDKVNIISDCENLQKGLPVGAKYEITEEPGEDYKTDATNAVGKVKDGVITVKFNNSTATIEDPIGDSDEENNNENQESKSIVKTGDLISISLAVCVLCVTLLSNILVAKKKEKNNK